MGVGICVATSIRASIPEWIQETTPRTTGIAPAPPYPAEFLGSAFPEETVSANTATAAVAETAAKSDGDRTSRPEHRAKARPRSALPPPTPAVSPVLFGTNGAPILE
jgi:hypothetical protein